MINTFEKSAHMEAETAADSGQEPAWYWCPTCKLASPKSGDCAGCGNAYAVAPTQGIPGAPYTPKVGPDRSRRTMVVSVASMLAVLFSAVFGIYMLASHGSATVGSSSAPAADGGTVDGTSSYVINSLHGSVHLPGVWATSMQSLQLSGAVTAGAQLKTELSVTKGSESIVVVSFPSSDPSSVLNQFVSTAPQTEPADSTGKKTTIEVSRQLSIAGYTAVAQDIEVRNAQGGMVGRGTLYAISTSNRVVVIRTQAAPAQADDLAAIEKALVNIG